MPNNEPHILDPHSFTDRMTMLFALAGLLEKSAEPIFIPNVTLVEANPMIEVMSTSYGIVLRLAEPWRHE